MNQQPQLSTNWINKTKIFLSKLKDIFLGRTVLMTTWESFTLIMIMISLAIGVMMLMFHLKILKPIPPCTVYVNKVETKVDRCITNHEAGRYTFELKGIEYSIRVNGSDSK